jgi:hypothetical protein
VLARLFLQIVVPNGLVRAVLLPAAATGARAVRGRARRLQALYQKGKFGESVPAGIIVRPAAPATGGGDRPVDA